MRAYGLYIILVLIFLYSCNDVSNSSKEFTLTFRSRINEEIQKNTKTIPPENVGIVVIDMWNHHWCKTATNRVGTMVPRMNKSFGTARKLGMTIFWAPTDGISKHLGTIPRIRAAAVPYHEIKKSRNLQINFTHHRAGCLCGPGIPCQGNYGWDGMHPGLVIEDKDYVVSSGEELYSLCKELNITTLIYSGVHTNICVVGKPPALKNMFDAGIDGLLARDLTDASIAPVPAEGITNEEGTADIVEDIENSGISTVNFGELMSRYDDNNTEVVTEQVRLVPWGIKSRPYSFLDSTIIAMSSPWLEDVEFRYTVDGSKPKKNSSLYIKPFVISETTIIRVVAFKKGKVVTLPNEGHYVKVPPLPPLPDVYLSDAEKIITEPLRFVFAPQKDLAYDGGILTFNDKKFERGIGMRSPAEMLFELKPEYDRFVATVAIDDRFLNELKDPRPGIYGRRVARYPSVKFRIFVDGEFVKSSPNMRVGSMPWNFDLQIPDGSQRLGIAVVSTGDPHPFELGDWVNAGFILKKEN